MSKIIIERSSEWNNKVREIGIYVDGEKVDTISDGEIQEYEVEYGAHEIYAKIDWCRSPKIKLNLIENETKTLKLSGFKYSKWILPALLGIILFYYLVKYALNVDLNFLIWIVVIGFLYPMYYITFGKNNYLILTEKDKKTCYNTVYSALRLNSLPKLLHQFAKLVSLQIAIVIYNGLYKDLR